MFEDLMAFIRDNPLPVILIGVAVLLFIALTILLIVWLRRRHAPEVLTLAPDTGAANDSWSMQPKMQSSFSSAKTNVGNAPVTGFSESPIGGFGATSSSTPTVERDANFDPAPFMSAPKPPLGGAGPGTVVLDRASRPKHAALLVDRKDATKRFELRAETDIGRTQANGIVIPDVTISRQHARIRLQGDRFVLFDLDSANGTFVNGRPVKQPETLTDGDIVRFGDVELVFKQLN